MGQINLSIPQVGLLNSTEDPKIASDFTTIQTWANGNIDPSNLSSNGGVLHLAYRLGSGSVSAAPGDYVVAVSSTSVNLPSPGTNWVVGITAASSVTGALPVTVNGTNIYGLGLSAASTFKLGAPGASVVLQSDGTNWFMTAGQQDTGWVAVTLAGSVGTAAGAYTPSSRLTGDRVFLKGTMQNNTGGNITAGATWATIPTAMRPTAATQGGAQSNNTISITTGGLVSTGVTLGNTATLGVDGVSYTIS